MDSHPRRQFQTYESASYEREMHMSLSLWDASFGPSMMKRVISAVNNFQFCGWRCAALAPLISISIRSTSDVWTNIIWDEQIWHSWPLADLGGNIPVLMYGRSDSFRALITTFLTAPWGSPDIKNEEGISCCKFNCANRYKTKKFHHSEPSTAIKSHRCIVLGLWLD